MNEQVTIKLNTNNDKQFLRTKIKNINNNVGKYFSMIISTFVGVILFAILGFILYKSIQGFEYYGIEKILFSDKFNISNGKEHGVSFWLPFVSTLLTTLIALLIAVPVGVKTSIFIKFRVDKKYKKTFRILSETLAGIPSVIFGLFASKSLGALLSQMGINNYSIINASIMLSFMIIPTIIAMSLNALDSVDKNLIINPIAIGSTKTRAIYKVYKKAARNGIIVAIIIAMGRAIGETMALSMILQNENGYIEGFNNGLLYSLNSDLKTVSVVIATNMFGENSNEITRSLLFVFGFILFIFIMIFNVLILYVTRQKGSRVSRLDKFIDKLYYYVLFIPRQISNIFEWLMFKERRSKKLISHEEIIEYTRIRTTNYKFANLYTWYKLFWEIFSFLLCLSILIWIILEIFVKGWVALGANSTSIFMYTKNTSGQAFLNTILVIFIAILIGLPISLISAIYLNEYSKNKYFNKTINFFLDSLGSTPSILFGMFGLIFFIETLGWTSDGAKGYSLIAGSLTIVLVILPSFTRSIQQALIQVPYEVRINALALGSSKWEVIYKIVLPAALTGIITSTILAIGRILSETAPLYLTAGLTSSTETALDRPGQTLTTRIYAQLYNTNITEGINIMYEIAFITLLLVLSLILIGYVLIPNKKEINKWFINKFQFIKYFFKKEMLLKNKEIYE
ncbi:phosphate ABC transporter permease PstA [Malacoplasma muris]|uniref:phosphate ABC transporter permease PstA n=1 Tax=Malacoplasma muris TaxID=2119 RepID=UPI00398E695D